MIVQAVKWVDGVDGYLELIDQRRLPVEFVKLQCRNVEQLYEAIKTLAVRGAPAIGVSAAYGAALAMQKLSEADNLQQALRVLTESCDYIASSRPTAVNLFRALDRIRQKAQDVACQRGAKLRVLRDAILAEANAIYQEDVDMCRRVGQNGERFIWGPQTRKTVFGAGPIRKTTRMGSRESLKQGVGILTHCNAGALATVGQGTALSIMFEARKKGRKFKVYADETRPLLQGARLTAWELKQAGIDVVVVCDNMAGWLMKQGKIDVVITGADRIAANGDAANKIGTYSLSILAREHGIPFYIAAPSSTFDLSVKSGAEIPIEQRAADEITTFANTQIAPDGVGVYNPAFDVTDVCNITAIITERGIIEKPDADKIAQHLQ